MDLDINNYEYDDILKLFNISNNFNEEDLKKAKKQVLLSHPDKSGLDKSYFLFFSSAYKTLFNLYNFRMKHSSLTNPDNYNDNYISEKDDLNEELLHKFKSNKSSKEFNIWFNEQFENFKIETDYDNNGYGEWLSGNDLLSAGLNENLDNCKDLASMNKIIDEKKKILRANMLIKKREICEFNNTNYCDLTNSKPEDYSSGLFSNFQYEDLKKAHEESIIPVTDEDNKNNFTSLEDIKFKRTQQNIVPMNSDEANKYLNESKNSDNSISTQRAFKLFKQEEINKKNNDKFWSNLKRLL